MTITDTTSTDLEPVEAFRLRAREWLKDNFPRSDGLRRLLRAAASDEEEIAEIQRQRDLQRHAQRARLLAGLSQPRAIASARQI